MNEIINLLNKYKNVIILTPNYYEKKLLYDRVKLDTINAILVTEDTIKVNDSYITFTTSDDFNLVNSYISLLIIEFPDQISHYILNRIMSENVIYVQEII